MSEIIVAKTEAEWLEIRKRGIGASETAGVLGVSPYSSPFSVWAMKTGDLTVAQTDRMRAGKVFEDGVAQLFVAETGLDVEDPGPFVMWWDGNIFATPDRAYYENGTYVPIECKFIGGPMWDEPPIYYQIQVQQQMYCMGATYGYIAAWFALQYKFCHWRIERNEKFIEAMVKRLDQFWDLVESKTPPAIDGSVATEAALKFLHPNDTGEVVQLPEEAWAWTKRLEEIKQEQRLIDDERRLIENQLRAAIGDATFGEVGDIRWSLKTTTKKEHVVKESTYRALRMSK